MFLPSLALFNMNLERTPDGAGFGGGAETPVDKAGAAAVKVERLRMLRQGKVKDERFARSMDDHFSDFDSAARIAMIGGTNLTHALLEAMWPDPHADAPKRVYAPTLQDLRDEFATGNIPEAVLRVTDDERKVLFLGEMLFIMCLTIRSLDNPSTLTSTSREVKSARWSKTL